MVPKPWNHNYITELYYRVCTLEIFLNTEKRFIFQVKEFGYIQLIYHKSIDLKV